ncbi:NitT/TauT family transport system substrate-binding protein [Leucobacter luti]|uniref:Thiamine pyrimidine synthase n=1 Tax=Leucobacter luti TaxID=340320 RepID=A0A4V6PVQ7_9MICO|nr:ABC transporter substrate-binding protein [Leucobacter luti]TDP94238.1 NitT/TauT family transport system substrate-binding protein [Leucobacter luti]
MRATQKSLVTRRTLSVLVAISTAVVLAACSGTGGAGTPEGTAEAGTEAVTVSLDWNSYVAYHAPFVLADEEGIWEKHGVQVKHTMPGGSGDALLEVGTAKTDIAWADLSTAAASMLQEVPVTAVAKVQNKNASGLTVLAGTQLDSARDVSGMRIGSTPGGSDSTLVGAFLRANGIDEADVEIVSLPANGKFAALMTGEVDAISGQVYYYISNAGSQGATAAGKSYSDMGLDVLDHGFVANDAFLEANPSAVTGFLAAYREALARTIDDPAAACAVLSSKSDGALLPDDCEAQLDGWLPLVSDPNESSWGESSEAEWESTVAVLKEFGGAEGDRQTSTMFTNEVLPND